MKTFFRLGSILVVLWAVAGCMPSLESNEPADRVYWLETVDVEGLDANVNVRVDVVPGLDSDRIWILQSDQRLNYYAGAFWTDSLAPLLQSVLERSLAGESGSSNGVTVELLVERFFAIETASDGGPPIELKARIQVRHSQVARGESISCVFDERRVAATDRLRDIVAAHQALLDALARESGRLALASSGGQPPKC